MTPQKILEIKTLEGDTVRIRVYSRGIVVERGGETNAFMAGVRVPDWLVEKSVSEIDPRELFRLKSPEVISRFVLRVGPRRVMSTLKGKIVDRDGSQCLILFEDEGRKRLYLKEKWAAEFWRLEEVGSSIPTVAAALAWRKLREARKEEVERLWRDLH